MNLRWTVGKKLAAGFGVAVLMLLLIGGVSYWSLSLLIDNAWWVAHTHQVLENLEGILSLLKDTESGQRGFILARKERYLKPYHEALEKIPQRLQEVRRLTSDNPSQQRRIDALEPILAAHNAELKKSIDLRKQDEDRDPVDLQNAKGLAAAMKVIRSDEGKTDMERIRKIVREMEAEEQQLLDKRTREEQASILLARITIIAGSLLTIGLLAVIGLVLGRGITRPLREVMDGAQKIAGGNLRQEKLPVASGDEIGQLTTAFNGMLTNLQELTRQTVEVTASLNAATAQIMASAQQQTAGTREQAATVQEITTTMEQISQAGAQIAQKARQVAAAAEAASVASNSGNMAVENTNRTMEAIREQVEQVAENIVALSEKTQAIGEIIATVNDVAERSNLLALNAAIEAAAAGEQGNRFSVVASEMKNLADQAKDSTVQVRTILGDIQKGINSSVMLTEEAVKRVETGKQQAGITEETIRQMAQTTLESVQAFEQIIGANNQQQIGFEQVAQGMKDIRQAATQTASATLQMEKAVANLSALGQDLRKAVGRYQL
jgi:methyl-accepting chemotaxis protein